VLVFLSFPEVMELCSHLDRRLGEAAVGARRALREARRGSPILSIAFAASSAVHLSERSCRSADRSKNHFNFFKPSWNKPSATDRIYNAVCTGRIKIKEQRGSLVAY